MSKTILKVVGGVCLILGICLGTSIGLWIAPGGESLGSFLKSVVGGTSIGCLSGGGIGIILLLVITAWMAGHKRRALILAIVLIVGSGLLLYLTIRHIPVECAQIKESELRALLGSGPVSTSAAKQWLHNSPFKGVHISETDYGDGTKGAQWYTEKARYRGDFRDDFLTRVYVDWELDEWDDLEPSGDEILACFGSPDLYRASYSMDLSGELVDFSLWYLEKGIVVSSRIPYKGVIVADRIPNEWRQPIIDGNVRMTGMTIVSPNSVEGMIRNVYPYAEENDEFRAEVLETLHSWPGSWGEVVVRGCVECPD